MENGELDMEIADLICFDVQSKCGTTAAAKEIHNGGAQLPPARIIVIACCNSCSV